MVVQHNLTAMNSNRMLNVTSKTQAKSTEKLSSGYKINRAADDAAGLSISEKMRKQIRGLTQASANAQDGISAVQTAEGALNEVQDMLQRMNELAVKAANGTNSSDDRSYIQNEVKQLETEIDRVAETTKFNETYLLKGDSGTTKKILEYNAFSDLGSVGAVTVGTPGAGAKSGTLVFDGTDWYNGSTKIGATTALASGDYKITVTNNTKAQVGDTIEFDATAKTAKYIEAKQYSLYDANGNRVASNGLDSYLKVADKTYSGTNKLYLDAGKTVEASATVVASMVKNTTTVNGDLSLKLHVGADATSNNQIEVGIASMSAKSIGVEGIDVSGADDFNALNAIETVKAAIQKISTQRSALGAVQNRLDHTINNLDNVVENTTSAESAIRDTDMASEMVKYSNNNILAQAGQAMLAQANQSNQGVLSLLG